MSPSPGALSSPDKLDESLSGGFTHILIVDGQDLVSWQEFILRGAACQDRGSGPTRASRSCGAEGKHGGPKHPQSICPPMWPWRTPCRRPGRGDRRGQEPREGSGAVFPGTLQPCPGAAPHPTCSHRAHHHGPLAASHKAESEEGVALDRHLSERGRRQLPTFHIIATALLRHHMAALQAQGQAVCEEPLRALPAATSPS